ncbi:DUF2470 domain-containing protein [Sneathiella chungangensis]|uniref:DUF2470 domain-containing protein n=1 Tax=Sneathiella chungangensis TaxID=1418234 RepID=A0A845MJA0_9PROT|nr:DUF2470 domain-containing protein [Sneathiella chungangensis]MZR24008.1 DUF2470 domain-containing protein [Sneathiella chungangensis]
MMDSATTDARAATVRKLLRTATTASLATAMPTGAQPYASLVLMATDPQARPLLLLSDLAVHSKNIAAGPAVSLLIAEDPADRDPLTLPRISLEGSLRKVEDSGLLARYVNRYPSARDFAGFRDFNLYRMEVARAHLVAGFGDIHWIDARDFLLDPGFPTDIDVESDIIEHMNKDHADAVQTLAAAAGPEPDGAFEMCGVDRDGIDLRCGWRYRRILFDAPVSTPGDVRKSLVRMLNNERN